MPSFANISINMIRPPCTTIPEILRASRMRQSITDVFAERTTNNNNEEMNNTAGDVGGGDLEDDGALSPAQPLSNPNPRRTFQRMNRNHGRLNTISRSRRRRRARVENEIATRRNETRAVNQPPQDRRIIVNSSGNNNNENVAPNIANHRGNNSFTISEHIGMIGARNFFIPPPDPRSIQCIECYKRAAFYLCMILIISGLLFLWNASIHPFHMMGRRFFVAEKYQSMFLTDEDFYPRAAMLIVYFTLILAGYAVHYSNQPVYDFGFTMYLHSARALIVFGFGFLVWHIWAHAANYPGESYVSELEAGMKKSLELAKGDSRIFNRTPGKVYLPTTNDIWIDTQTVFKCCGIHDFHDWLPADVKGLSSSSYLLSSNFSKLVPTSCCEKLIAESCEAIYVNKMGCLEAQMKVLNTEALWVINPGLFVAVLAHFALYITLGRLFSNTVAITRERRPFEPPPPTQIEPQPIQHNNA